MSVAKYAHTVQYDEYSRLHIKTAYPIRICKVIGCRNPIQRRIYNRYESSICGVCGDHNYYKEDYMDFPVIAWGTREFLYELDLVQLGPHEFIDHLLYFLRYHLAVYHDCIYPVNYNKNILKHLGIPPLKPKTDIEYATAMERIRCADLYTIKYFGATITDIYKRLERELRRFSPWREFNKKWTIGPVDTNIPESSNVYDMLKKIYTVIYYKNLVKIKLN